MLAHWIWLATMPELHESEKVRLLQHFSDPEDIYYADPELFRDIDGITEKQRDALRNKDLGEAERIIAQCRQKQIHILTYRDAAYPARLKHISDPPVVLYYKGTLPDFDAAPVIGIVGTRKASAYGLNAAKRIGYEIGSCGGLVVSGCAFGIDSLSMQGALSAGQSVVGVLGCGADVVYPVSNRALFADLEKFGCLLTEFVPGTPPHKWNFPKRNRIISGLSNGLLVVEAPQISGALITARAAAEQGRDVFVVPGNIDNPLCEGSNALLRDGAIAVSCGWDVVSEYEALYPGKLCKAVEKSKLTLHPRELQQQLRVAQKTETPTGKAPAAQNGDKKTIDKAAQPPYSDGNEEKPVLTETEQAIVALLQGGQQPVDNIIAATGLSTGLVLATLTMLEVKGVVCSLPGKRVVLKTQK